MSRSRHWLKAPPGNSATPKAIAFRRLRMRDAMSAHCRPGRPCGLSQSFAALAVSSGVTDGSAGSAGSARGHSWALLRHPLSSLQSVDCPTSIWG
ncbi:hypothetical protein SKAU_G00310260 [Synaphobranchus kaupii]|uniref:Uncharacterized protein n=1 Tax=Synaphobranchus kaupii TaxID=118154 RepID=A0A9Q1ERM3_SYNKA|nr:hypothetical protein SKAU_G00310260 [Synaphobranchus kaupii]